MMSSVHHGRGSEVKGMHFYLTIQLRQLRDQELMIPRNFVERYWKDVSNPISLRLPNGSSCKVNWVQRGDDIWLQNWKRFARSLRCGDLFVFQYKGGSDFHVIILDDSKLEIDYSSMTCNDAQENTKESDDDDDECVEIPSDGEHAKIPLKKKRINSSGIATTAATPQWTNIVKRKTNINATRQKVSEANRNRGGMYKKAQKCSKTKDGNDRICSNSHHNENPSFTVKLSPYHVEGQGRRLRIPNWFSKEYMNELLQGKATIRSVGEARAREVTLNFDKSKSSFVMQVGWKPFSKEHDLKVGDECKFEMIRREPLSFKITIIPATKEPCPEQFQGCGHAENQRVQGKSVTTRDMENVGNYGEGISNSFPKAHGLRNSACPNLHDKFKVFVTSLDKLVVLSSEMLKRHNIFNANSVELKVGERTWFVEVNYDLYLDYGWFTKGWQEFVRECKVKIGDTCLFEMIDVQNHVFKVSIIPDVYQNVCVSSFCN